MCSASVQAQAPRPNIILIMADDMGFSDIGPYGGEIETPALDSLAANGVRFSQFYNTGRCCPTRASLLTGLYPHQTGLGHMVSDGDQTAQNGPGYAGGITGRCVTMAEVLKTAGYATYMSGKWHIAANEGTDFESLPIQRGFDRFFGIYNGGANYFTGSAPSFHRLAVDNTIIPAHENFYFTNDISDSAVKFISDHSVSGKDNPFFLYVAYTSPHWPLHALKQDIDKYRTRYTDGWEVLRAERYARMKAMGLIKDEWDLSARDGSTFSSVAADKQAELALRMAIYAAQVDCMDQGIGQITDALKTFEYFENTLIIFIADNGGCAEGGELGGGAASQLESKEGWVLSYGRVWANTSNTPFRLYKHWVHEGGISTPLIAHWPAGITLREEWEPQPGHLVDLMPTFIEVAGAEYPRAYEGNLIIPMEGVSLVGAFHETPIQRENPIFWEHEGNRAVRDGKWKLVAQGGNGAWELYDMEADRSELNNLASTMTDKVNERRTVPS
jgi:arylsulfatase